MYLGVLGEVFLKSLGSAGVLGVVLRDLPLAAAQLQQKIFLRMTVQKNIKFLSMWSKKNNTVLASPNF